MNLLPKNKYLSIIKVFVCLATIGMDCISAKWWLLSQYNLSSVSVHVICDHIPGLQRTQRQYCRRFPDIMQSIGEGIRQGIHECQQQFRHNRWNCSTNERDFTLFGKYVLNSLSRENAFIHAILSAGAVHSITRWCSSGLLSNCACDPMRTDGRGHDIFGDFSWGGCSQYLRFAAIFARKFIDKQEMHFRDANALMNLHNNRVGRKIVFEKTRLVCKCHGMSGSCLVRTCWRITDDFRSVSTHLKHKYNNAKRVHIYQTGNRVRHDRDIRWRAPETQDLIFLDSSPDYCNVNQQNDSYGTEGRICNKTSSGPDSCDIMCCGSGYQTKRILMRYRCRCTFYWCCQVDCQECKEMQTIYVCRGGRGG